MKKIERLKKAWEKVWKFIQEVFVGRSNYSKMTYEEKEVAREIGIFILKENISKYPESEHHFVYIKTLESINILGITSILLERGNVVIKLHSPGLLIGKKGSRISAMEKALDKKILIHEDTLRDFLIPYWYLDEYNDDVMAEVL